MGDRLKGSVSYGRTVSLEKFASVRVDMFSEFYLDESSFVDELQKLRLRVDLVVDAQLKALQGQK